MTIRATVTNPYTKQQKTFFFLAGGGRGVRCNTDRNVEKCIIFSQKKMCKSANWASNL